MRNDCWDPAHYELFCAERAQPFYDLLSLVLARPGGRGIDLGCGTGRLTRVLHDRLGLAETLGVDSSAAMLSEATAYAANGIRFEQGAIADVDRWLETSGPFDVVFANAVLHWLPEHTALLANLSRLVTPGGRLAVQIPANDDYPTHTIAAALSAEQPWRDRLGGLERSLSVLAPEAYSSTLYDLGYVDLHVRLQVYPHLLSDREAVVTWARGTLLTWYEERLPTETWDTFLTTYSQRLTAALADNRPFFYPFKRILFAATRPLRP